MLCLKANDMWYSNNNPFGTPKNYYDDISEDQPFIWLESIGFVTISKAQIFEALYYFQRDLHIGDGCTIEHLYELLGLTTKLKTIMTAKLNDYLTSYGWCMEYIYDYGYSWLDFYFKKGQTDTGITYYELDYNVEPIDLTVPFDAD